jgi:hypothetical protein
MSTPSKAGAIFSPEKTQKHIDALLGILPPKAKRVVLIYGKTDGTFHAAYVERFSKHWSGGVVVEHAPETGWDGTVAFQGVW